MARARGQRDARDRTAPRARAGSWRAGTRRSRSRRAGLDCLSRPAGAAPRRAESSWRGSRADRSCSYRRPGGSRSAGGRLWRPAGRSPGRARCPARPPTRCAAAAARRRCACRPRAAGVGDGGLGVRIARTGGPGRTRALLPRRLRDLAVAAAPEPGGRRRRATTRRAGGRRGSRLAQPTGARGDARDLGSS